MIPRLKQENKVITVQYTRYQLTHNFTYAISHIKCQYFFSLTKNPYNLHRLENEELKFTPCSLQLQNLISHMHCSLEALNPRIESDDKRPTLAKLCIIFSIPLQRLRWRLFFLLKVHLRELIYNLFELILSDNYF